MGTRADFYVGRGESAEWLGSVAYDGMDLAAPIKAAADEGAYRIAVAAELAQRDDATLPAQGWPWPWEDSRTTDYAYAWDDGQVWACAFGRVWWPAKDERPDDCGPKTAVFPNMKDRQRVTFGPRSGVLVVGLPVKENNR